MAAIDIGPGATDRASAMGNSTHTYIDFGNPANDTGTIDTFEIWVSTSSIDVIIGTFSGSGDSWDDRDYESIGTVNSGAKRTFTSLDCDVATNDCVGVYHVTSHEATTSGESGVGDYNGDAFGSGAQTYDITTYAGYAISLYGSGVTVSGQTIEAGTIASSSIIHALQVNLGLLMSHIASVLVVHEPVIELQLKFIYPDHISSGAVVHEPSVLLMHQYLLPDHIASGLVLYEPTVILGDQFILPEHISSGATVHSLLVRVARVGRAYRIEIRDASDNLITILENAYAIPYERSINKVPMLSFNIPADDDKVSEITRARQIWLREIHSNTVIERFRLRTIEDKRV